MTYRLELEIKGVSDLNALTNFLSFIGVTIVSAHLAPKEAQAVPEPKETPSVKMKDLFPPEQVGAFFAALSPQECFVLRTIQRHPGISRESIGQLSQHDTRWGVRALRDVVATAEAQGINPRSVFAEHRDRGRTYYYSGPMMRYLPLKDVSMPARSAPRRKTPGTKRRS